jgi:hypothetical protein
MVSIGDRIPDARHLLDGLLDEKSYTIGSWLRIWRRAEGIFSSTFDWIYVEENLHRAYSSIDDNKVETLRR